MNDKGKPSDEDVRLFRETVDTLKPHNKDAVTATEPQRAAQKIHLDDRLTQTVKGHEILSFKRTGLQHQVFKQLKNGQIHIDNRLDLHGMIVDEAREALAGFIHHAIAHREKCLLIIHGKGQRINAEPILKNKINTWLRQIPQVLAFVSATANDGGRGAVYVLLKSSLKGTGRTR